MRHALIALAAVAGLACSSGWAKDDKLDSVMILKGTCTKLVLQGKDRSGDCINKVFNTAYRSGRTGFYFTTEDGAVVTFSGMGTQQIKIDENSAVSPVDMLIVGLGPNNNDKLKAVGTCRYSNPYKGPSPVACHAETTFGSYDASFTSDGSEPDLKKF